MDDSVISCKQLVTGMSPASSQSGAGIDTQIGAGVDQEAPLVRKWQRNFVVAGHPSARALAFGALATPRRATDA